MGLCFLSTEAEITAGKGAGCSEAVVPPSLPPSLALCLPPSLFLTLAQKLRHEMRMKTCSRSVIPHSGYF